MKRLLLIGLAVTAILLIGASFAFAQDQVTTPGGGPGVNFVDADGDGVCDNCTGIGGQGAMNGYRYGNGSGLNFVDADGDGVCDNFVDADGDGICDNCMGLGMQNGGRYGQGAGAGGRGYGRNQFRQS